MRKSVIIVALAALQVNASRDDNVIESVQVSAGSHFVKNKQHMVDVQKHRDDPVSAIPAADASAADPAAEAVPAAPAKKGAKMSPEMRAEVANFAQMAVAALSNKADPSKSHEEKAAMVQKALAQAANAMTMMASMADLSKHPDIANELENFKKLTASVPQEAAPATPPAASLLQTRPQPERLVMPEKPSAPSLIQESQTPEQAAAESRLAASKGATNSNLDSARVKDGSKKLFSDSLKESGVVSSKADLPKDDSVGVEGKLHDLRRMATTFGGPIAAGSMAPPPRPSVAGLPKLNE